MCTHFVSRLLICALLLITGCDQDQEKKKVDADVKQMASNNNKTEEATQESVKLSNPSFHVVEQYWNVTQEMIQTIMRRERENMEKASEMIKRENDRRERLIAEDKLSGRAELSQHPQIEESNHEYRLRIEKEMRDGKYN